MQFDSRLFTDVPGIGVEPAQGPSTSADGGIAGSGYERVVNHTVAKPEDYYIMPESHSSVVPMRTEDSGASNIYEEVPNRRNFHRYPTPEGQTSGLSGTYATVLHSGTPSQRASAKSGLSSNVSLSGNGSTGVARQTPRLIAAGPKGREMGSAESSMIQSEYQPLLSGGVQRATNYTDRHERQHNIAQADTLPESLSAGGRVKLKDLAGGESTVDDEVPLVPRKYHTEGNVRRKHHAEDQH